ncbi:MAG: DUF177 domain-containing protein [Desulfovibrio sp.]|nr:DUF177 domain-containing protein [Desulfovibrio sp.]
MSKNLVSINDLPPAGKEFVLDDQQIWLDPIREFKMDCRITEPLKMKAFVQATDEGCVVRGELTGAVVVPCNRCAENAPVAFDSKFDEYEEIPASPKQRLEDSHIVFDHNAPMLNLDEVAWEQLMLAMPPNPLCRDDCKGLCPDCGSNLNIAACECSKDEGDPRMRIFREMAAEKK